MKLHRAKKFRQERRAFRSRNRIRAAGTRPRLSVHRTDKHITAQVIDDEKQQTVAYATTVGKNAPKGGGNLEGAKAIGRKIAELALSQGVKQVAFDRGRFRYHGRVKALADAAREAGLEF